MKARRNLLLLAVVLLLALLAVVGHSIDRCLQEDARKLAQPTQAPINAALRQRLDSLGGQWHLLGPEAEWHPASPQDSTATQPRSAAEWRERIYRQLDTLRKAIH